MRYFANSVEHLLAELERIDLLIRSQVARLRTLQAEDEQFRGLYVSDQEVDELLKNPIGVPQWLLSEPGRSAEIESALEQRRRQINDRKQESISRGIEPRLVTLQQLFGLTTFDVDTLLICMSIELDLRYERLYAYLQDDVTRKKPSVDLVFSLLAPSVERRLAARERFSSEAPLLRHRLVELFEDPPQSRAPLLSKYIKVDDRILQFLLDRTEVDDRLRPFVFRVEPLKRLDELCLDESTKRGLQGLSHDLCDAQQIVVHLRGPYGVGKQSVAEALCREAALPLLVVDLERLLAETEGGFGKALVLIHREARLQRAAVYWDGFDALLPEQLRGSLTAFLREIEVAIRPTLLGGEASWAPVHVLRGPRYLSVSLPHPTFAQRSEMWRTALDDYARVDAPLDIASLSTKFKFTRGQIQDATATAKSLARWRDPDLSQITVKDLYDACRMHSNQVLATLARKITPNFQWDDIVLPADRVGQLREICNHMKYRNRVYGEWGFEHKLALGKGLTVLFVGPSGTGKTMAADIIAGALGLDLYKIDLSSVISKYIGETEKNLARIFEEAETSNAILFFDEADALFGKRSEVRDSHDRYANIEVGYLLQRMEEYEGVAILATNFRKNMDEAFVRRLQFTVGFPFPNQEDRLRIWESIWPEDTPRDDQIDVEFLAERFEITGGNIRNIAVAAAFLAADDGQMVRMGHLMLATQREYQKMGKLIAEKEFKRDPAPGRGTGKVSPTAIP